MWNYIWRWYNSKKITFSGATGVYKVTSINMIWSDWSQCAHLVWGLESECLHSETWALLSSPLVASAALWGDERADGDNRRRLEKTFTMTTGAHLRACPGPLFWRSGLPEPPPRHAVVAKSELTQTKQTWLCKLRTLYWGFQGNAAVCLHSPDAASAFPFLVNSAIIRSSWFLTSDGNTHVNQIRAKAKTWIIRAFSRCSQLTLILFHRVLSNV